jgi:hypothetical protein
VFAVSEGTGKPQIKEITIIKRHEGGSFNNFERGKRAFPIRCGRELLQISEESTRYGKVEGKTAYSTRDAPREESRATLPELKRNKIKIKKHKAPPSAENAAGALLRAFSLSFFRQALFLWTFFV